MEKQALTYLLLYFIFPLWIVMGVADWFCHKRTHIETTTGFKESFIHSLMFLEIGIPVMVGLLFEITNFMLIMMVFFFLLHELTAFWDVSSSYTQRHISPVEQHVHSFLELLPLMALLMVIALHWSSFIGIFQGNPLDFSFRFKSPFLPLYYLIPLFLGIIILLILPYSEELKRTWLQRKRPHTPFS